ncbi:SDR family NAD(P)-dependent oxidoreductase [Rhodoligotrophos defluvii]|uniref:SDR family NAD(P)-dependent oxidoreductase n=1 Tax=Rhodoligotrophos defluvii TaxID=2561934 RepID=UPI0010CA18C9|nr:SDR family NAD(P)-dependent oxidoreductase [Rhodoligotrophos defluvii]
MRRLEGHTVLITGGASGIGEATAGRLAEEGAHILIADRDQDGLARLVGALEAAGRRVEAAHYDQSRPETITAMFASLRQRHARLDACFVNAGYGRYGEFLSVDLGDWQRHIDVNLTGSFVVAQEAARWMADAGNGGAIIFNASTAAAHECDLFAAYAASKAGLLMLARTMASELGSFRIRVNVILPGVIATAMTKGLLSEENYAETVAAETPLGRFGTGADIAAAVAFLASDDGAFVTGTTLVIDGGQTLHGYPRWFAADYREKGRPLWRPYLVNGHKMA